MNQEAFNELKKVQELQMREIDVNALEYRALLFMTSSKGNQRKWYNHITDEYIKEAFYYQGKYWKDWNVEVLAYRIACLLGYDNFVLAQEAVRIKDFDRITKGCVSKNFCKDEEQVLTVQRLLEREHMYYPENGFIEQQFECIVKVVRDCCDIDITEYLKIMMVIDYLVLNEDRHLNNIAILKCKDSTFKLPPLFDFGLGLFEHDRRYEQKELDQAIELVQMKPFSGLHDRGIRYLCKQGLALDCEPLKRIEVEAFPSILAYKYFQYAVKHLEELL